MVTHYRKAFEKKEILWLRTARACRPNYLTRPDKQVQDRYQYGEVEYDSTDFDE